MDLVELAPRMGPAGCEPFGSMRVTIVPRTDQIPPAAIYLYGPDRPFRDRCLGGIEGENRSRPRSRKTSV